FGLSSREVWTDLIGVVELLALESRHGGRHSATTAGLPRTPGRLDSKTCEGGSCSRAQRARRDALAPRRRPRRAGPAVARSGGGAPGPRRRGPAPRAQLGALPAAG